MKTVFTRCLQQTGHWQFFNTSLRYKNTTLKIICANVFYHMHRITTLFKPIFYLIVMLTWRMSVHIPFYFYFICTETYLNWQCFSFFFVFFKQIYIFIFQKHVNILLKNYMWINCQLTNCLCGRDQVYGI